MYVMCDWVYQMTHCPDRAVRRRQLKTSWTSTGTSREPVRVMEPQVELLMMGQEVSKYCCVYLAITVIAVDASESGLLPSGFLELSALEFGAIYYRIYEKNTVKTQRKHSYYPLIVYVDRSLCGWQRARLSPRRHPAEHFHRWPPGLSQPDSTAAWLQVLIQVWNSQSCRKPQNQYTNNHFRLLSRSSQLMLLIRNFSFVSSSDAKKKLRLALCSADSVALPIMAPATTRNGLPDHMDSEGRQFFWIYENMELFVSSVFLFEVEHFSASVMATVSTDHET